ncbi:MAG TPA: YceD family protein [Rhodanobacteraceae bacterium]|nr:YceD family protein [Rhodanobacteraceae bacterium]
MSVVLPEYVEVARMVQARRSFQGSIPLAAMPRLCDSLAATEGAARYDLEFGVDEMGTGSLSLHVEACLPLVCQRTLDIYIQPVSVDQRLGLVADENDEAALPEGCEAVLVVDGRLRLRDVIEDELILALPLIPISPGDPLRYSAGPAADADDGSVPDSPFAVLDRLKQH